MKIENMLLSFILLFFVAFSFQYLFSNIFVEKNEINLINKTDSQHFQSISNDISTSLSALVNKVNDEGVNLFTAFSVISALFLTIIPLLAQILITSPEYVINFFANSILGLYVPQDILSICLTLIYSIIFVKIIFFILNRLDQ